MKKRIIERKRMPKVLELIPDEKKLTNNAIIELLEELIEMAENNEFINLVVAGKLSTEDSILTSYVGDGEYVKQQELASFLQSSITYTMIYDNVVEDVLDGIEFE